MRYQGFASGASVYHRLQGHAVVQKAGPVFSVVRFDSGAVENVSNMMLSAQPFQRPTIAVVPAVANDYAKVKQAMWRIRSRRMAPRTPSQSSIAKIQELQRDITDLTEVISAASKDINALRETRVLYPGGKGYVQPVEFLAAQGRKVFAQAQLHSKELQLRALQRAQEVRGRSSG